MLAQEGRRRIESYLGHLTPAAVAVVDAFATGRRQLGGPGGAGQGASTAGDGFSAQLSIVLNGIEVTRRTAPPATRTAEAPPHIIQSELWQTLHYIRESAELSYAREMDLVELDRRILFLLHTRGALSPADIAAIAGVDKAQVSRSVKRMLGLGLVQRKQLRSPLGLTADGEALGRRVARIAELRNRELTFDISDAELMNFFTTVELLLDRAVVLYERERDFIEGTGESGSEKTSPLDGVMARRSSDRNMFDLTRITSPLMTLNAYFNRSGALAFKRLTGLSKFEAFVLSEIGRNPPIEWADLVGALRRDHSQAGRTINALMERGLIERGGEPGRRYGWFAPTEAGKHLYDIIYRTGQERSVFLLAPLEPEQRLRFIATFDKLKRNALAQLHRERAFSDFDAKH